MAWLSAEDRAFFKGLLVVLILVSLFFSMLPHVQVQAASVPSQSPAVVNSSPEAIPAPPPSPTLLPEFSLPSIPGFDAFVSQPPSATTHQKVTGLVLSTAETTLTSASGKVSLKFPVGSVIKSTRIELIEQAPYDVGARKMLGLFQLNATVEGSGEKVTRFLMPFQIAIQHVPGELTGLDTGKLRLYSYDDAGQRWLPVRTSNFDQGKQLLTSESDLPAYYADLADYLVPPTSIPNNANTSPAQLSSSATVPAPALVTPTQPTLPQTPPVAGKYTPSQASPTPPPSKEYSKTTGLAMPNAETTMTSADNRTTLRLPAGAVSQVVKVEMTRKDPPDSIGRQFLSLFEFNATVNGTTQKVTTFGKKLQLTIRHDPKELIPYDLIKLKLYSYDTNKKEWIEVPGSQFDVRTSTLTAEIEHFSLYAEQTDYLQLTSGRALGAQSSLFTGAATFSYPMELPPGPGGFKPNVTLTYDSGLADEMKSKGAVGSWVGIGWELNLGYIKYDSNRGIYYMHLNGSTYDLCPGDAGSSYFLTYPESNFKVTHTVSTDSSDKWEVYDTSGSYYRFGGTANSLDYVYQKQEYDGVCYESKYYRGWGLNLVQDLNGNQATITYTQVLGARGSYPPLYLEWVRAAYPSVLSYGNNQVTFSLSQTSNYNDGWGSVRIDSPPTTYWTEGGKLDSIEIKTNSTRVRKYLFSENTTSYSGTNAGYHTLYSIKQVGTSDGNELTAMTFSYQNLPNFWFDASGQALYGDNVSDRLMWPHLTAVNSGYGGSVNFSYAQNATSDNCAWARQVVVGRVVDGGLGTTQTDNFSYTGKPNYRGLGPQQQFRGFSQVRVTDNASNYTDHYFFTTGMVSGLNTERFSGREYQTLYYSSGGSPVKQVENEWIYQSTDNSRRVYHWWAHLIWGLDYIPSSTYNYYLATGVSGDVYATGTAYFTGARVWRYDASGRYLASWGRDGSTSTSFPTWTPRGIAVSSDNSVYVIDQSNYVVHKYSDNGTLLASYGSYGSGNGQFRVPKGIAVDSSGNFYVTDGETSGGNYYNYRIQKFSSGGVYQTQWGSYGTGNGQFFDIRDIAISSDGRVYVSDYGYPGRIQVFDTSGNYITKWNGNFYTGLGVDSANYVYVSYGNETSKYTPGGSLISTALGNSPTDSTVSLDTLITTGGFGESIPLGRAVLSGRTETTFGTDKVSKTIYSYDAYGNVVTERRMGDISTTADDSTVWRVFTANTSANILNKVSRERVYSDNASTDNGGGTLVRESLYYYDGAGSYTTAPTKGNLTKLEQKKNASTYISTTLSYDAKGNILSKTDPRGNTESWTYDANYIYPATHILPVSGLSESFSYDPGTSNLISKTDVNGLTTSFEYDTFKRPTKVIKPGDSSGSPSISYEFNNWGTVGSQNITATVKLDASNSLWQKEFFDGFGRVIQAHAQGETGHTIISSTTTFNNRGLTYKQYVSQDIASAVTTYQTPAGDWKYTSYVYDALGRVTSATKPDGTSISHDYSTAWKDIVTNERGYKKRNSFDAFGRLVTVEEMDSNGTSVYATTQYTFDKLGNLTQVLDNSNNTTSITYDWLGRKTAMTDPDMGSWTYGYDNNGNLTSQTDAKSQTITLTYDALNRLTGKTYPGGSGMTNVSYSYDSTSGGNYGKGLRTGMTDALGTTSYKFDNRSRLVQENRAVTGDTTYTTAFGYDGADRNTWTYYPTTENVTTTYNGRGLPYSLSGTAAGTLVSSAVYNGLGMMTSLTAGSGTTTSYGYYGLDTAGDTSWGRLWKISAVKSGTTLQETIHAWDAGGNLTQRINYLSGSDNQTEDFSYDFLDRLTGVSGAYSNSYAYNPLGNITSFNGSSYSYGSKPHAVTLAGSSSYGYDANGNLTSDNTSRNRTLTWDAENRPVSVVANGVTTTFVYDGDGKRVKKTVSGVSTLYINAFYEKTVDNVTTSYFFGGKLVAQRVNTTLSYLLTDHLGSTSVTTNSSGTVTGTLRYAAFGAVRSGTVSTDIRFTGQRADDSTGLYFYNARYYDPELGRFVSPDTVVQSPANPQTLNRYAYALNNPMKYIDPSGYAVNGFDDLSDLEAAISLGILSYYDLDKEVTLVSMGTGMTNPSEMQTYLNYLDSNGKSYLVFKDINMGLDVGERVSQIRNAVGFFSGDTIFNLLGYSEGAAADVSYMNEIKGSRTADNINNVFLLERPTGKGGFGDANLSELFSYFGKANAWDIWNKASLLVHDSVSGNYPRSYSYWSDTAGSSGAGMSVAAAMAVTRTGAGIVGAGVISYQVIMTEHGEPLLSSSKALAFFHENWKL